MKFEKTYKEYMKQFVAEGLLGSVAAAIPRTIGTAVGNVVKQAYADNPYVQAFGQVRQKQQGERSDIRSKNKQILAEVINELKDNPNFNNTTITFTDSTFVNPMSGGNRIQNLNISYRELETKKVDKNNNTIFSRVRTIDDGQVVGIRDLINETDLRTLNLFDNNTQDKIKQEILKVWKKTEKDEKREQGEDYKKVNPEIDKIFINVKEDINNSLKPLGAGKHGESKIEWLYILSYLGGKTSLHVKR